MTLRTLTGLALAFATDAHGNQRRKYTGDTYMLHVLGVTTLVEGVSNTEAMLAAALLHDVVEDTKVTIEELRLEFGSEVAALVNEVTDVSRAEDGSRAVRKAIDRAHLAKASVQGKTIKLADLINNTESIVQHDRKFARVYLREKAQLLEVLGEGDKTLLAMAKALLARSAAELGLELTGSAVA